MWNVECGNGKSLVSPVFILEAAHFRISTFHIKQNLFCTFPGLTDLLSSGKQRSKCNDVPVLLYFIY